MHKLILASILTLSLFAQTKKSLPSAILYQSGVPSIACTVSNNYGTISVDFVGGALYVCKSTGWVSSGLAFSSFGTDGMIPFRSGVGAVVGDSGLTWDNTNKYLTTGTSQTRILLGSVSALPGLWFGGNAASPSVSNYGFLYDATNLAFNVPTGGALAFRVHNANALTVDSSRNIFIAGGSLTSTQGTLTGASTPFLSHTATWNNAATTYINDDSNVTDTASAAGSMLIRRQVGGVTQFSVSKTGVITSAGGFQRVPVALSALPACAAGNDGLTRYINDAASPSWNATVTGGGAVKVMVYCNGTNWTAY